jgi:hypothetical protein
MKMPMKNLTVSTGIYSRLLFALIVGAHKMHIFTANIRTFHSRYRRYALITNEFHEFY